MRLTTALMFLLALAHPMPLLAAQSPRLADLAWLEGSWQGPGIDGAPALETYSAPAGGQIVGHFRQLNGDGSVMFYELMTIVERDGRLIYRLKHFHPDLRGWEEREEIREFALTRAMAERWEFGALILERLSENRLRATVSIAGEDGKPQELRFEYTRR